MPVRLLLHIPRGAIKLVLFIVVIGIVLFIALTRTEVGRDQLRQEVERRFAQEFKGELKIGDLNGNLANVLFAKDVQLLAPDGQTILTVDSVVVHPRWLSLLSQTVSISQVTLIRPVIEATLLVDGTWNVAATFQKQDPDSVSNPSPWSIESADIRIRDGALITHNQGALPQAVADGKVFDYTEAYWGDLNIQAILDWQTDRKQMGLVSLTANLDNPDFEIDALQGQLVWADQTVSLNEVSLQAGETNLSLNLTIEGLDKLNRTELGEAAIDVELNTSQLDGTGLRRLVPAFPFDGLVEVETRLEGPFSDLVLETVSVKHKRSTLLGTGTIYGLPDSALFEMEFPDNLVFGAEIQQLLPEIVALQSLNLDSTRYTIRTHGVIEQHLPENTITYTAHADFDAGSSVGDLSGLLSLEKKRDTLPRYTAEVSTEALNVGALLMRPQLYTDLNATLRAEGTGLTLEEAVSRLSLGIGPSQLAGRSVDSLYIDLQAMPERLEGHIYLEQPEGMLFTSAILDYKNNIPIYQVDATAQNLDLGPLLLNDSLETKLNTRLLLSGQGLQDPSLQGTFDVVFDSSTVRLRDQIRHIPPHQSQLALLPLLAEGPRLTVRGDMAVLDVEGHLAFKPLVAIADLWQYALKQAIDRETSKSYARSSSGQTTELSSISSTTTDLEQTLKQETVRMEMEKAGLETALDLSIALHLKRPDILSALLPVLPEMKNDVYLDVDLSSDASAFILQGAIQSDSLSVSNLRADSLQTRLSFAGDLDRPLEYSLVAEIHAESKSFKANQSFYLPILHANLLDRSLSLSFNSSPNGELGPLRFASTIDLLQDRNRLTLDQLDVTFGEYFLTNPTAYHVDFYNDAVVIPELSFTSQNPSSDDIQRIDIQGIISSSPQDSLQVDARQIVLRQLMDFVGIKPKFGGLLNGSFVLTGIGVRPEVTGQVNIETFAIDQNILGDLSLTSQYLPGQPDIALNLELIPTVADLTDTIYGTLIPANVREDRLQIEGTFRLPSTDSRTGIKDPGAWDLEATIDRADFFILNYIFTDVVENPTGYLDGRAHISGGITRPIFHADLQLHDGQFGIPMFNLFYTLNGTLSVDEEAIHFVEGTLADQAGGEAVISGDVLFNDYRFFSFDLAAQFSELQIMNIGASDDLPFFGFIWVSGNVTFTGPLNNVMLRTNDAEATQASELFIPVTDTAADSDEGFIVFSDEEGSIPDLRARSTRSNVLSGRPVGERPFLDGLDMDLSLYAPPGSTVHLVIDPLTGDVMNAVGTGRIQLQRNEGEFFTFGSFSVNSGDYLFTAGDVFVRRFLIEEGGMLSWDGDPTDAVLNVPAVYRTRASAAGLPGTNDEELQSLIPVIVKLLISGRVSAVSVDLSLEIDRSFQTDIGPQYQRLEDLMNTPERSTEYATSVLLTNSFQLTTDNLSPSAGSQIAFQSVSQLVSSQLNRFLSQAIPNVDFTFGLQGQNAQDLDVSYGVALRLLDDRLIVRGEGIYQTSRSTVTEASAVQESLQGEFVVQVRLNPSISVEIFYRRASDVVIPNALTDTAGAGLSYQTEFTSWKSFFGRLFGWLSPKKEAEPLLPPPPPDVAISNEDS